jgi:hypothetical protein
MKVLLFACADSASLDARSNRLSLFHLTEELNAASFPAIHPTMSVVAIVERSAQEPQRGSLLITGELNGKQIFSLPFAVDFQTHLKARAIADIQGLPLSGPGKLTIKALDGTTVVASWPMQVNHIGQPQIHVQTAAGATKGQIAMPATSSPKKAKP